MLRGVHKSIIEVVETDNQFFEKAILFVRPAAREQSTDVLRERAKEYLSSVSSGSFRRKTGVKVKERPTILVKVGLGLAVLAVACLLLFLF